MGLYDGKWGEALVGKFLLELRESEDLYIKTPDGIWLAEAEGDCCAHAYVSSVVNGAAFANSEIVSCTVKDVPADYDDGSEDYCEVRDVHFFEIKTKKGAIDIILHVDHNGYYGGWLNEPHLTPCSEWPADVPVLES